MNFVAIIFTVIFLLFLFRVFISKARANRLDNPTFRALPKDAALAVLKDKLLNNPTENNLKNLVDFAAELGQTVNADEYKPLIAEQLRLSALPNALAEDNILFAKESAFLDSITPPEIAMANEAKQAGNIEDYINLMLDAVERFYSDEKIEETLATLIADYPRASELLQGYIELKQARDESLADDESLKKLREKRDAWQRSLRN